MLHGERVTLRALDPGDAAIMWHWYRSQEFSTLDGNRYGTALPPLEEFVRSLGPPSFADVSLGIEDEHETLIGIVRLKRGSPEDRNADFGIAIERDRWNQGYGTDATRTILRFAFAEMNLHRVSLHVREDNARARRCYEKCGFREERRERERRFHGGRWIDRIIMGILQHEFEVRDS